MSQPTLRVRLRRLARAVRHTPDRLLHRRRRLRELARIRARGLPRTILFVCHGNICRSPYAAAAYAALLPEQAPERSGIDSAGFVGPGRPPPTEAIQSAAKRGLDLTSHRSKLMTLESVGAAELVVVMDARQQREVCRLYGRSVTSVLVLGDLDPEPIDTRAIRDPWGQSEEVFDSSYARIDRCLRAFVEAAGAASALDCGVGVSYTDAP